MSIVAQHKPLIIGHRGAAACVPENTMVSFERAIGDGADGIEFDVRLARDQMAVVIHDATLKRTGRREETVAALTSEELSRIDVGTWFNLRSPSMSRPEYAEACVPTLAAVFERFGPARVLLYVEMKCGPNDSRALAAEVARLIRLHSLHDSVVVESFYLDAIAEVKRVDAFVRTAALFEPTRTRPWPAIRKMIERARDCGADELALHRLLATRRNVEQAREAGMPVVVWTVDNPAWVRRASSYGVHGLITNDPARMRPSP
jgi:glycerophosphoryl diester phosphodiesterase